MENKAPDRPNAGRGRGQLLQRLRPRVNVAGLASNESPPVGLSHGAGGFSSTAAEAVAVAPAAAIAPAAPQTVVRQLDFSKLRADHPKLPFEENAVRESRFNIKSPEQFSVQFQRRNTHWISTERFEARGLQFKMTSANQCPLACRPRQNTDVPPERQLSSIYDHVFTSFDHAQKIRQNAADFDTNPCGRILDESQRLTFLCEYLQPSALAIGVSKWQRVEDCEPGYGDVHHRHECRSLLDQYRVTVTSAAMEDICVRLEHIIATPGTLYALRDDREDTLFDSNTGQRYSGLQDFVLRKDQSRTFTIRLYGHRQQAAVGKAAAGAAPFTKEEERRDSRIALVFLSRTRSNPTAKPSSFCLGIDRPSIAECECPPVDPEDHEKHSVAELNMSAVWEIKNFAGRQPRLEPVNGLCLFNSDTLSSLSHKSHRGLTWSAQLITQPREDGSNRWREIAHVYLVPAFDGRVYRAGRAKSVWANYTITLLDREGHDIVAIRCEPDQLTDEGGAVATLRSDDFAAGVRGDGSLRFRIDLSIADLGEMGKCVKLLRALLADQTLTHFRVGAQRELFTLHTAVSAVFKDRLSQMSDDADTWFIDLPDVSAVAFKAFNEAVYFDNWKFLSDKDLTQEVLFLAEKFKVADLKRYCDDALADYVDQTTALEILTKCAALCNAERTKAACIAILAEHIGFQRSPIWQNFQQRNSSVAQGILNAIRDSPSTARSFSNRLPSADSQASLQFHDISKRRKLLRGLRADKTLVHFKVGPEEEIFPLFKVILTSCSSALEDMLERNSAEAQRGFIRLPNVSAAAFKAFASAAYHDNNWSFRSNADLTQDVLHLAEEYKIADLKIFCDELLADKVTTNNALALEVLTGSAAVCSAEKTKAVCINILAEQTDFRHSQMWLDFKKNNSFHASDILADLFDLQCRSTDTMRQCLNEAGHEKAELEARLKTDMEVKLQRQVEQVKREMSRASSAVELRLRTDLQRLRTDLEHASAVESQLRHDLRVSAQSNSGLVNELGLVRRQLAQLRSQPTTTAVWPLVALSQDDCPDLVERVNELQQQIRERQSELERFKACSLCFVEYSETRYREALIPCGHSTFCCECIAKHVVEEQRRAFNAAVADARLHHRPEPRNVADVANSPTCPNCRKVFTARQRLFD